MAAIRLLMFASNVRIASVLPAGERAIASITAGIKILKCGTRRQKKGNRIRPNDVVYNKKTGETLVVAGVHYDGKTLVPKGYPFPSVVNTEDCLLVESGYIGNPQEKNIINAFLNRGMQSYVDAISAMFHGFIGGSDE